MTATSKVAVLVWSGGLYIVPKESASRAGIARVFQPDRVSGIDQNPCRQIQSALRTLYDHHLFGRVVHLAGNYKMGNDCLPERPRPEGIGKDVQRGRLPEEAGCDTAICAFARSENDGWKESASEG